MKDKREEDELQIAALCLALPVLPLPMLGEERAAAIAGIFLNRGCILSY